MTRSWLALLAFLSLQLANLAALEEFGDIIQEVDAISLEMQRLQRRLDDLRRNMSLVTATPTAGFKYKIFPETKNSHLTFVMDALEQGGYKRTYGQDYQLLWVFDYPFTKDYTQQDLTTIVPGRFVNHLPQSSQMTLKSALYQLHENIRTAYAEHNMPFRSFMPQTFPLPEKAAEVEAAVGNKFFEGQRPLWLWKDFNHMGVAVLKELPSIENGTKGLVQSYINALHVDNHMYDVGVYFVITSVHPLRLYVFDEWLVRVCKKRFPTTIEDFDDAESFVIRDYQPLWNMESVGPIHRQLKHNRKALLKYLDSKGIDSNALWESMQDSLTRVVLANTPRMRDTLRYKYRHFKPFEMLRADFIITKEGHDMITEINMSPNLVQKNQFDEMMKRRLLTDLFQLLGLLDENAYAQSKSDAHYRFAGSFCSSCSTQTRDKMIDAAQEIARKPPRWSLRFPVPAASRAKFTPLLLDEEEDQTANEWADKGYPGLIEDPRPPPSPRHAPPTTTHREPGAVAIDNTQLNAVLVAVGCVALGFLLRSKVV